MSAQNSQSREAVVRFEPGNYKVVQSGHYVRCAVTDKVILLKDLVYWDVGSQEAYASAEIAAQAYEARMDRGGRP